MKVRRNYILTIAAIILTPAIFMAGLSLWNRHIVAEAHRIVQRQGIRTKPDQFDFSLPTEFQDRGLAILRADIKLGITPITDIKAPVVRAIVSHRRTLPVIWTSNYFELRRLADPWSAVRASLQEYQSDIEAARAALLSGPFGFHVKAADTIEMKVGHIEQLPDVLRTLNLCIVADLHDGRFDDAWTNVLAATRCLTAWQAERTSLAQIARFRMIGIVLPGIWQALQSHTWSEAQLNSLEREWISLNFFADLPEMAEYEAAYALDAMQIVRTDFTGSNLTIRELIAEPKEIPRFLKDYVGLAWYRAHGFHADQRDILFYCRDRYFDVRRAVSAKTLAEMRALPGMTNITPPVSRHGPYVPAFVDCDHYSIEGVGGVGLGFVGLAAEAEIRRRLILAVIALEKHRVITSEYPENLAGAEFTDFADGKILRYRRISKTQFELYSAGLNCLDDGGNGSPPSDQLVSRLRQPVDILWPHPDSAL